MDIRKFIPWWLKIVMKIVLSRLSISYKVWQKLNLFRHGLMDEPEYAYRTFLRHFENAKIDSHKNDFVMLELGPGDSLASGIIAGCYGAKESYLVDRSDDAIKSNQSYLGFFTFLQQEIEGVSLPENDLSITEICDRWNIHYLIEGLASLKKIPDNSVDFLWSQSVLEHIRKADFEEYARQFRRILKVDGVSAHGVDLKDHMSYSHNNLRFSEKIWESDFMASSGFYTNRILFSEMTAIFANSGFDVETINIEKWAALPTKRSSLSSEFAELLEEDLVISDFDIILKPV